MHGIPRFTPNSLIPSVNALDSQEGQARGLIRALNLGQMEHARQPGAGWRGAKVLAQMLIHRAGKGFSSSADLFFVSRFCQQISLVSRCVFCQQIPSADFVRRLLWYKSTEILVWEFDQRCRIPLNNRMSVSDHGHQNEKASVKCIDDTPRNAITFCSLSIYVRIFLSSAVLLCLRSFCQKMFLVSRFPFVSRFCQQICIFSADSVSRFSLSADLIFVSRFLCRRQRNDAARSISRPPDF